MEILIVFEQARATYTTEQAYEPFCDWLSRMRKVPSHFPRSNSSAWVRLMSPTYQVPSSWWGEPSSSSSEYELETRAPNIFILMIIFPVVGNEWMHCIICHVSPWDENHHTHTYSSASFFMPSHSLIFFCLVPFCVSHLKTRPSVQSYSHRAANVMKLVHIWVEQTCVALH